MRSVASPNWPTRNPESNARQETEDLAHTLRGQNAATGSGDRGGRGWRSTVEIAAAPYTALLHLSARYGRGPIYSRRTRREFPRRSLCKFSFEKTTSTKLSGS